MQRGGDQRVRRDRSWSRRAIARHKPIARGLVLAFAGLCVSACGGEPPDPLDPDAVSKVGNQPGTGRGSTFSGTYDTRVVLTDCDCPTLTAEDFPDGGASLGIDPDDEIDLCEQIEVFYDRPPIEGGTVDIDQVDGQIFWPEWIPVMSGPVESDGEFVVAGYEDFSQSFFDAEVVSRVDGRHIDANRFTGALRERLIGELPGLPIDCRATHQIDGTRIEAQ